MFKGVIRFIDGCFLHHRISEKPADEVRKRKMEQQQQQQQKNNSIVYTWL
jgi:NADH:ubiquinone oxidoreductase subunit